MKIKTTDNKESGNITLPQQFSEAVRGDLIKRAFLAIRSNQRQPYGADPRAGKKSAPKLSRRRRKWKASYGHGISRVPRKTLSRRGERFIWAGAFAPGMVGGRRAFPPRANKDWSQKINDKERKKALRSALSATLQKQLVEARGHKAPSDYPFILEEKAEDIKQTRDVEKMLESLGFAKELERSSNIRIRAGQGKSRGRKYQKPTGPLIVASKVCPLLKSAANIPGVDAVEVRKVNALLLAPGGVPGRITLYTKGSIELLQKEKLFQ